MVRRRSQRRDERHEQILHILASAHEPIMGADLGRRLGVSRQILVYDVNVLRAEGHDIIATAGGYILRPATATPQAVLQVQHDQAAIMDEASILVDLGIHVLDEAIEHPIFGPLRGALPLASRQDALEYLETLERTGNRPLLALVTGGRHSHTVEAPRPDLLDRAREDLRQRGYLVE